MGSLARPWSGYALAALVIVAGAPGRAGAEPDPTRPAPVRPDVALITARHLAASPDGPVPADHLARAEQMMVRGLRWRVREYEASERVWSAQRRGDGPGQARARRRQRAAHDQAVRCLQRAADLLAAVAAERPTARLRALDLRIDVLDQLGRTAEADADAAAVIAHCTACRVAAGAHVRLGERAYAAGQPAAAAVHYRAALAVTSAPADVRGFASFALAWCRHDLGDAAGALDELTRTRALADELGARGKLLAREAARSAAVIAGNR